MKPRALIPLLLLAASLPASAAPFAPRDLVRVKKGEMLRFNGEDFQPAAKGQDFTVLKHDPATRRVFLAYVKDDESLIAVTLPDDVVELAPPNAWQDLVNAAAAFREQRHEEAVRLFQRASQDATVKPIASSIAARAAAARTGTPAGTRGLRDFAEQLAKAGLPSLALALDEGLDRLPQPPPSKLDRAELGRRAETARLATMRIRQAVARHRLIEAKKHLQNALAAEPGNLELKSLEAKLQKDVASADEYLTNANEMRRFQKGAIHALTAIEHGLKIAADHPQLRALKQEMSAMFEERTSPPITPAFLAAMKINGPGDSLAEGRKLYTTRCAECHDLEMLDSRSMDGWTRAVAGMAGRAKLKPDEQSRILEYLAVAVPAVAAGVGQ